MVEKMGDYHENSDNISTSQEAKNWTERSKDSKLNGILHKLNDEEKKRPSNDKLKEIQKLQNLLIRGEYSQFQKKIGLTNYDGRLGGETLDKLEKFLASSHHQEYIPKTNNSKWETEQRKDEAEAEEKLSRYINGDKTSNISLDRKTPGIKPMAQDAGPTLLSLGNDRQSIEQGIFHERPRLGILGKKLHFDWTSKFNFVKPHLDDLNQLSSKSLSKIKSAVKGICISDKTITSRNTNRHLIGVTPRGYPEGMDWSHVGGCYGNGFVYAGRNMKQDGSYYKHEDIYNDSREGTDSLVLHEIGHAIDEKYDVSTRPSFKNYHKQFYDRIGSYFRQGGPGGTAGCSEFFAEASAEFHKRGKEKFTKYYNEDFYNYMEDVLC